MDAYAATLSAVAGNPKTIGLLVAATTRRGHIDAITLSSQAAPADNTIVWTVQRFTVSGTATTKAGAAKDPASPAPSLTSKENSSAEPTYTANLELLDEGINQRSLARFVYAPGRELVTNTTTDNGIGAKAVHASATPAMNVTFEWVE